MIPTETYTLTLIIFALIVIILIFIIYFVYRTLKQSRKETNTLIKSIELFLNVQPPKFKATYETEEIRAQHLREDCIILENEMKEIKGETNEKK